MKKLSIGDIILAKDDGVFLYRDDTDGEHYKNLMSTEDTIMFLGQVKIENTSWRMLKVLTWQGIGWMWAGSLCFHEDDDDLYRCVNLDEFIHRPPVGFIHESGPPSIVDVIRSEVALKS